MGEEVQQERGFRHRGEVGGAKRELWTDLSGYERITGRFEVRRPYKYSAELTVQYPYPWVLRGSLEQNYANL